MKEYKNRTIEKVIKEIKNKYPVIAITGPRQVGKTTLLEYLTRDSAEKINYVTLYNLLYQNLANEDPELFLRNFETPLIIDEFQYAPKLLNYIKINVDESKKIELFENKAGKTLYYLTGSQVFETMKDLSESLAGRVAILDLYGFSAREINGLPESPFIPDISAIKIKDKVPKLSTPKIFDNIINGSYPELNSGIKIDREMYYQSYIKTYIERDVRKIINIKDENKFMKFICSIAVRTACEYNATDIAKDIEVDSKTVDEWLSILVNTHLIYLLNSYSNNNIKKIIKRPKIYFMDTGLACYLAGYFNATTLEKSAYSGNIFETYVISEIIKSFTNNGKDPKGKLFYYRDKDKREIDLLIQYDNIIYPIEIKKSANPGKEAIKNFNVTANFGVLIGSGIVLCMVSEITAIDSNNYFVPIEYI